MPLLSCCITISANGALQPNYHQYDISSAAKAIREKCLSTGNQRRVRGSVDTNVASEPTGGRSTLTHTYTHRDFVCFNYRLFLFYSKSQFGLWCVFLQTKGNPNFSKMKPRIIKITKIFTFEANLGLLCPLWFPVSNICFIAVKSLLFLFITNGSIRTSH